MEETLVERIKMAAQFINKETPTAADWICCADSLMYCLVDAVIEKRKVMADLSRKFSEEYDVQG